jgi:hypothetical protein
MCVSHLNIGIHRVDFGTKQLAFPPQVTDWLRFSRYASLVRRLHYNIHAPTHKHLHHSVFDEIARTRLHLRVFPNLHTLEWITGGMNDMKMSVVFMHDRVKHFIVWVPFEKQIHLDRASPTPYFHDVAARMPKLTHLDLRMDVPSSLVTAPVINLLTSLAALETVIFPNYHITSEILTSLSTLPYLGIILFEWDSDQGDGSLDDVQTVTPTLSQGAFPALWDLSLTSTLRDMRRFFELPFAPVNLTNLYVDCPCLQSVEVVGGFLKSVAENCQMLKALCLELRWADFTGSHTTRENRITFETIKPLLECPNLVLVTPLPCMSSSIR